MVASLCNRSTDAVFRFVERNSGLAGSKTKSEGINAAGKTEEMYATSTSGTGPTGPASTSTGRSFIPAVSPNGKLARQISPGRIYGLAIRQRIKVLPNVAQLVTPSLRHVPGPKDARLVFIRPDDNQLDTPGRQVSRCFSADVVVVVDFAHYADRSHTVSIWILSRSKVWLRALQDGLAPNPVGAPLDRALRDKVHLAPDDAGEFLFHSDVIHQAPVRIRGELHQ